MAGAVIGVVGLDKIMSQVGQWMAQSEAQIDAAVQKAALDCERYAKILVPVDTGNLRASLTYENAGQYKAVVGTNVEYGIYQELGTHKMAAQPYLYPAYEQAKGELMAALKKLR